MRQPFFFKLFLLTGLLLSTHAMAEAQNCNLSASDTRRTQTVNMIQPYSFVVQMTMKRGKSYNGTAFLIHPRVLLTAGHNLRKRNSVFTTRVKSVTLCFGATNATTNLAQQNFATEQFENIYTLQSFNEDYTIWNDYGIVILPNDNGFQQAGGHFKLSIYDSLALQNKLIHIAGYPGDRPFRTQWQDSTSNYFFFNRYFHYDFATEHGASGAPIWYNDNNERKVFAIHTNGDHFDQFRCNTGTLITKTVYDDIVRFCRSKGIDITQ